MTTPNLSKGKTAILIMDCQNDIVHERGKMAAMNGGVMAKLIKDRNVLGTISRLAQAGRVGEASDHPRAPRLSSRLSRRAPKYSYPGLDEDQRDP